MQTEYVGLCGPKLKVQCSNRLVDFLLKQLMRQVTGSDLISEGSQWLSSKSTVPQVCFLASCWDSVKTLSAGLFAETASPVHWGWFCVTPSGGLRPRAPLPDTGPSACPPPCVLLRAPEA